MSRKSARFIAQELIGYTTDDVYQIWKDMGVIAKDTIGFKLTDYGRSVGGRMSKSNHSPVPTFDSDTIIDLMIKFYEEHKVK